MKNSYGKGLFFYAAVAALLLGCGPKDDNSNLLGIWRIYSSKVNNVEIGDGKGWLDFKEGGKVDARTGPGMYDSGNNYALKIDTKTLELFTDSTKQTYSYKMNGDSMTMTAMLENMPLFLGLVKVEEYPMTPDKEGAASAMPF
jgi:hypothetical protein